MSKHRKVTLRMIYRTLSTVTTNMKGDKSWLLSLVLSAEPKSQLRLQDIYLPYIVMANCRSTAGKLFAFMTPPKKNVHRLSQHTFWEATTAILKNSFIHPEILILTSRDTKIVCEFRSGKLTEVHRLLVPQSGTCVDQMDTLRSETRSSRPTGS